MPVSLSVTIAVMNSAISTDMKNENRRLLYFFGMAI